MASKATNPTAKEFSYYNLPLISFTSSIVANGDMLIKYADWVLMICGW